MNEFHNIHLIIFHSLCKICALQKKNQNSFWCRDSVIFAITLIELIIITELNFLWKPFCFKSKIFAEFAAKKCSFDIFCTSTFLRFYTPDRYWCANDKHSINSDIPTLNAKLFITNDDVIIYIKCHATKKVVSILYRRRLDSFASMHIKWFMTH